MFAVFGFLIALFAPLPAMAACTYGACAPTNVVVNTVVTQYAAEQTTGLISDRISQAMSAINSSGSFASVPSFNRRTPALAFGNGGHKFGFGGGRDAMAAEEMKRIGVWADISYLSLRDTQPGADYNGQIMTGIVGFDYMFNKRVVLGFALGHERVNLATVFNSGQMKSRGIAGAFYGGYTFSPRYNLDFTVGYAGIRYNDAHGGVTGSFNGQRWFGATNLNSQFAKGNWRIGNSIGLFYVTERQDGYVESNGNPVASSTPFVGQLRLKQMLGYNMLTDWGSLLPYASARFDFDLIKSDPPVINSLGQTARQGNFATTFGVGLSANFGGALTATIEGTTTQFRENFLSYGIRGNVRGQF